MLAFIKYAKAMGISVAGSRKWQRFTTYFHMHDSCKTLPK